LLKTL